MAVSISQHRGIIAAFLCANEYHQNDGKNVPNGRKETNENKKNR